MILDGSGAASNEDIVIVPQIFFGISGIAVDHRKNILYWAESSTSNNVIMHLNMTEWRLHGVNLVS